MTQRGAPRVETTRKKMTKKVRRAFDADALVDLCVRQDFSDYATRVDLPPGRDGHPRFYYYQDNGSDVLAVAHLDSVQEDGTCKVVETSAGLLAVSGTLDDRLGVYVILELLPRLGVTCDWLLTTDEEMGQSTAEDFAEDQRGDGGKDYNWMFQFDRGGTDVVMYDYETPDLVALVEDSGARVGMGSFSDICMLENLGCVGLNWGVGYQDYHGPRAHAWLEDTFRMVGSFLRFYEANANFYLPYEPRPRYRFGGVGWDDGLDDDELRELREWFDQRQHDAEHGDGFQHGGGPL